MGYWDARRRCWEWERGVWSMGVGGGERVVLGCGMGWVGRGGGGGERGGGGKWRMWLLGWDRGFLKGCSLWGRGGGVW